MCGLIGLYFKESVKKDDVIMEEIIAMGISMLDTLRMRGPDESSLVQVGHAVLGHTRLSIIDLETGSQPIYNEDRTVAVVLNGEIYNFRELRVDLEKNGHFFKTNSDTEVIVHMYEEYGEQVFSKLNGMFAIVIYDVRLNTLLVARDRIGEKPVLYWESDEIFVVASEIKALLKIPKVLRNIDENAVALFLNSMYIAAPISIFSGIKKLQPAHYLKINRKKLEMKKYWIPSQDVDWHLNEADINEQFIDLFSDAIKIRAYSDVPFGIFLSGGIDSSAVTAVMAKNYSGNIKTFTVGFSQEVDERPYAKLVADQYKTNHTELLVSDRIEDVVEQVLRYFDEPFGDSSAIPTYLVSREARKYVKMILTGDGGDELFAGYGSYIDQKYQIGNRVIGKIYKTLNQLTLKHFEKGILENKYSHSADVSRAFEHWHWVRTVFHQNQLKLILQQNFCDIGNYFKKHQWLNIKSQDALSVSFSFDLNYYLPDDLLKKVDMASMLAGLECRAPFLDYRIIELSLKIPPNLKVKNDNLKYILKSSLTNYLPQEILNRPKVGFGSPINSWLQFQLKDLVTSVLAPGCKIEYFIDRKFIQYYIDLLYSSKSNNDYRISQQVWLFLVLEIWMRNYL